MNRCLNCGHIFTDEETAVWEERHGFTDGLYEHFCGCPMCKGDYETDIEVCDLCGEAFAEEELYNGLCIDCLKSKMTADLGYSCLEDANVLVPFVFEQLADTPYNDAYYRAGDKLFEMAQDYFIKKRQELGDAEMVRNLNEWIFDNDESWGGELFSAFLKQEGKL